MPLSLLIKRSFPNLQQLTGENDTYATQSIKTGI